MHLNFGKETIQYQIMYLFKCTYVYVSLPFMCLGWWLSLRCVTYSLHVHRIGRWGSMVYVINAYHFHCQFSSRIQIMTNKHLQQQRFQWIRKCKRVRYNIQLTCPKAPDPSSFPLDQFAGAVTANKLHSKINISMSFGLFLLSRCNRRL